MKIRKFKSKATRSSINGKPQFVKYISPLALKSFGDYMLKHQTQEDGKLREGDNWRQGVNDPLWNKALIDSAFRHFLDWWLINDGYESEARSDEEEALNAILFGVQARLHNILKTQHDKKKK